MSRCVGARGLLLSADFRSLHFHRGSDLHYLATSPAFQKSGAGKALIQWGVSRAQAEGLPVHLEGGSGAPTLLPLRYLPQLTVRMFHLHAQQKLSPFTKS